MDEIDIKNIFKGKNIKYTKHREMIYDVLSKSNYPIAAEDIYIRLKEMDSTICLSTVYRILDAFIDKNIVVKSSMAGKNKSIFEIEPMDHRHRLICIGCKKTINVEGCPLKEYERLLQKKTDFDITGHHLDLVGYCPKCKQKQHEGQQK